MVYLVLLDTNGKRRTSLQTRGLRLAPNVDSVSMLATPRGPLVALLGRSLSELLHSVTLRAVDTKAILTPSMISTFLIQNRRMMYSVDANEK